MARRSACERMLEIIEQDPRFLLAGPAAAMIWLKLARMMTRLGDPLVLRLGSVFGSWSEVAFGLRLSETELETHLETLAARGLILREEDGLAMPEWLGLRDRRAEAARRNGALGGRPKKNASVPGQGNILYPMAGGRDQKPTETENETQEGSQSETLSRARPLSPENQDPLESEKQAALVSLTGELVAIGKLDPRQRHNPQIVQGWLDQGATPELLKRAFRQVAARANPPTRPPLSYFSGVVKALIEEAGAMAPAAAAEARTPEEQALTREWEQIIQRWQADGCPGSIRPPSRSAWLGGEIADREVWLQYRRIGAEAFREVA